MGDVNYCLLDEPATLVWVANLAAIELHPSLATGADLESPTSVVFDLDPGPPADVLDLRPGGPAGAGDPRAASDSSCGRRRRAARACSCTCRSTAGPPTPRPSRSPSPWPGCSSGTIRTWWSACMERSRRKDKVLIDWSQNTASKTTVAVYSVRALPQPSVSTPVTLGRAGRRPRRPVTPAPCVSSPARCSTGSGGSGDLHGPVLEIGPGAARWRTRQKLEGAELGIPARRPARSPGASGPGRPAGRTARPRCGATTCAATSSRSRHVPTARPASRPAPRVVASSSGETSTGPAAGVGQGLHEHPVGAHAAVDAQAARRRGRRRARPPRAGRRPEWAIPSSTARTISGRPVPRVRPNRAPRAPKSHCGVPKPSRAGTATTPPVSVAAGRHRLGLGRVAEQPEVVDQPVDRGAGRQHDRLDAPGQPARRDCQATIGKQPPSPRASNAGPGLAHADVEHGAGAEGGLGQARPGAALPHQRGLLIADQGAQRAGCPAGRWPRRAARRSRRSSGRRGWAGVRRRSMASWRQPLPSGRYRPVTAGVAGVGDVEGPPAQLPGEPGVDGAELGGVALVRGSVWSSSQANLVADSLGENRRPSACSSRQVPTVRRSCQPSPGPSGCAGAAVPGDGGRPLGGDADRLDRAARRRGRLGGHLDGRGGHGGRVELHQTRHGDVRRQRAGGARGSTVASGRTMAARTLLVPTSITRMLMAVPPWVGRGPGAAGEAGEMGEATAPAGAPRAGGGGRRWAAGGGGWGRLRRRRGGRLASGGALDRAGSSSE